MYCGNCGTQNDDSSRFCMGCGAVLNEEPAPVFTPEVAPETPAPQKSKKGLFIGIGAAIVAVAVALILILGGSSPKSVVKKYMNAFLDNNPKALLKVIPKAVLEEDIGDKDDQQDWVDETEEYLDKMFERIDDYYDSWSIKFEIKEVDDVKKSVKKDIQEEYEEDYDCKVKDVKEVTVKVTMKLDGDKETNEMTIYVVKIGGKWYVDMLNSDDIF